MHARVRPRMRVCICMFVCMCAFACVCPCVSMRVFLMCAVQVFACVCRRFRRTSSMRCFLSCHVELLLRPILLHVECACSALRACRLQWLHHTPKLPLRPRYTLLSIVRERKKHLETCQRPTGKQRHCSNRGDGARTRKLFLLATRQHGLVVCAMPSEQARADVTRQSLRLTPQGCSWIEPWTSLTRSETHTTRQSSRWLRAGSNLITHT